MNDLLAEYAELTRQLMEITRRRNDLGQQIERARKAEQSTDFRVEERRVAEALRAVVKDGDMMKQANAIGLPLPRLQQLFWNLLLRTRTAFPEHDAILPRRVGPRTLERSREWLPIVEKYLKSVR